MAEKYTSNDIQVLTDQQHVRLRTNLYLGSNEVTQFRIPIFGKDKLEITDIEFIPAVYKSVGEILDNSIDELSQITKPNKLIKIDAQNILGTYTISDNGRGVPIDKHEVGKYTPEVVFGSLRSGRNFGDDRDSGVIGQNGVGSSCVNYVSTSFHIDIVRDGKRYMQEFTDGGLHVSPPSIEKYKSKDTGTTITFQLDSSVFKSVSLPEVLIRNRAMEIALTNPGFEVTYNKEVFHYKHGFDDIIKKLSPTGQYYKFITDGIEFYVIFDINTGIDEMMFTWVNSSFLFDGGVCNTVFLNSFYDKVTNHLKSQAKKEKTEITKNDIREGLLIIGNLKLSNVTYDSQSKTRLISPNIRKEVDALIDEHWNKFVRQNKVWIETVLQRSVLRHHQTANKKAVKDMQKNLNKKIPELRDANSKDRSKCRLFVSEGLSAAGSIIEVRDVETMGVYPLTGKINNVYGCSVAQILNMNKVSNLFSSIGLIPGEVIPRENLRYNELVIATDADPDGSDIFSLLINIFYQFCPYLFNPKEKPFFYRLTAPNIIAIKGKNRKYFPNKKSFNYEAYKGWEVRYLKGLGSMESCDWVSVINNPDYFLPIFDDGNMKDVMKLLFSEDVEPRKNWLQER